MLAEIKFDTPIKNLRGIGSARAALFTSVGIETARDLLYYFPRRYENRGAVVSIADAPEDEPCSLIVTIDGMPSERLSKNGLLYTRSPQTTEPDFWSLCSSTSAG
jgi:ATP-dependent DNA helicase RecG